MNRLLLPPALAAAATLAAAPAAPAQDSPDPATAHTLPADKPALGPGSIFDLESTWRDQDGNELALSGLGDRVRVVVMGYSTCQFACPRLIADLLAIESALADDPVAGDVGYAFISIDPENDTPEQLEKLGQQYRFTPGAWKLMTGDEDGVLELAIVLGMKFRKVDAGDFAHSNIITILARDGSIAHQQGGLGEDKAATLAAIREAVAAGAEAR